MPPSNVLVVVVDGLRASALGGYGNTTFPTPALDRFAAESLLLDACYAPTADLAGIYRGLWRSLHPARPASSGSREGLPSAFAVRGYHTTLISDDRQLELLAGTDGFHERVLLANSSDGGTPLSRSDDVPQTELAHVFAAASELISSPRNLDGGAADHLPGPKLVWVHTRGMYGSWNAPLEFQQSLLDDDSAPPIETTSPPDFTIAAGDDPDTAFRFACGYAAQVLALDVCWQGLLDTIDEPARDNPWLVMLIGARGFPLGEHRRIGGIDSRMYAEQVHVPWLIRFPDGRGRLARVGTLATHLDVLPTLLDWIDDGEQGAGHTFDGFSALRLATNEMSSLRDAILSMAADGACSFRTFAWCLRGRTVACRGRIIRAPRRSMGSERHIEALPRSLGGATCLGRQNSAWLGIWRADP